MSTAGTVETTAVRSAHGKSECLFLSVEKKPQKPLQTYINDVVCQFQLWRQTNQRQAVIVVILLVC